MYNLIICEFDNIDIAEITCQNLRKQYDNINKIILKYNKNNTRVSSISAKIPPESIYHISSFGGVSPFEFSSNIANIDVENNTQKKYNKITVKIYLKTDTNDIINIITSDIRNMGGNKIKVV